MTNFFVLETN